MAELHPQLKKDCLLIGQFSLCRLLLMPDANYPWFILVPDRDNISEIHQLSTDDQHTLINESSRLATLMETLFNPDKMNIAAIGNIVPQLHVHHVARFKNDVAWPAPIWGKVEARAYAENEIQNIISELKKHLTEDFVFLI
ncbi:MAG: HIT domain-containing protein [Gammaproteobacteria bacterium]|nr:HIT domain-containing protein [Gammaproteobacteria bacterium]